jgi:hypothetical protein
MTVPASLNTSAEVLAQMDEFGHTASTKIGDLSEGGLTMSVATEEITIKSGSQIEIYAYGKGSTEQTMSGELLNINVNNLAFAIGMTENTTNITGTGTSGDPHILTVDPELIGQQIARLYYATGTRVDGKIVRFEATTGRVFAPDVSMTLTQGEAAVIPFSLRVTGTWLLKQNTP